MQFMFTNRPLEKVPCQLAEEFKVRLKTALFAIMVRKGATSAFRGVAVPSLCCWDSWPSHDAGGGLFCDFEPFRTASGPSHRWRLHETEMPSS